MQSQNMGPPQDRSKNADHTGRNTRVKQEITLLPISNKTFGDPDFSVAAFASSGLPVSITVSGACIMAGHRLHIAKAGVCTVTVHQDGDDKYDAAPDAAQSFSVEPARLVVKADDKTMYYGGTMPALSATISGIITSESLGNLSFKTNALHGSPPGNYSIIPFGLNSSDYIVDYVAGNLTILPALATIKADDKSMFYGEPLPEFTVTASGLADGDTIESLGNISFDTTASFGCDVGTYSIVPSGLSSPNYSFEYINGKLEISPSLLAVKADDKSVFYGEPLPEFTVKVDGLAEKDVLESLGNLSFCTTVDEMKVGNYSITPDGLSSANYKIEYFGGNLEILPVPVTVMVDDNTIKYGEPLPEFTAAISGLIEGDNGETLGKLTFRTVASQGSGVGVYSVVADGFSSPNYSFEYVDGKLEILPALLTVKADDKSMLYGEPLPEFTVTINGLVEGDLPESLGDLSFRSIVGEMRVGNYSIVPEGLSSPNYTIDHVAGNLEVLQAPVTVVADDKNVKYGDSLPEFTVMVAGMAPGDNIESLQGLCFECSAGPDSPVGSYSINPGGLISDNYIFDYVPGKLDIQPVSLIVKADDKDMITGQPLPEFTATVSGLVNGETVTSLGKLSFSTPANRNSKPGQYDIIPSGLVSSNYSYVYKNGTLTITTPAGKPNASSSDSIDSDKLSDSQKSDVTKKPRLGDLLVQDGKITSSDLEEALGQQEEQQQRLGEILVREGKITPENLVAALSKQLDVPAIDINTFQIEKEALKLVSAAIAYQFKAVPLTVSSGYLVVAMADPTNITAIETLTATTKMRVKPLIASVEDVEKALDRNYKSFGELEKQFIETKKTTRINELDEAIADAPAVRALDIIVEEAVKNRASDIHIEPQEEHVRIRYRIDGVLHEVSLLPLSAHGPLISRLKVLAEMNIADHRPQDGQFSFRARDKDVDVRVATISTAYGEMGTLRILDKSYAIRTLQDIGFSPGNFTRYQKILKSPFGMILVSGPTGSGKTTTLYASINNLDCKELNIVTIEDPVEYHFENINQIQVNPRAGLTFSDGLRSIMRHDPDVALVGEIRDRDTAATAVQAAMTGHLVLASVHANDTVGVLFRLIDLGIEPFLLASALICVVAQRMVRRVCPHCKEDSPVSMENSVAYAEEMGESKELFTYGKGCQICSNTGYLGRTAVMEILTISDEIRRLLLSNAGSTEIREQAIKEGMVSMRHDGMLKVKSGITTINEVMRNIISIQ